MDKQLPIYNLEIISDMESDVEVDYVALVDRPAIEKNFLAFKDQTEKVSFAIQDEDQHIITGALMLADTPIYRNDQNGEYYVQFSKDTIKQIAQKFFQKGYQCNVNLMHDSGQKLEGLTMYESWITDSKRGVHAMRGFEDVPDGSWFGSFKVENPEIWQMVKDGLIRGFSVEGLFSYKKSAINQDAVQKLWQQIQDVLSEVELGGPGSGRRSEGGGDKTSSPKSVVNVSKADIDTTMQKAKESGHEIDKMGKDLASKYGGTVTPLNYKSADSIQRKVDNEYGGNVNELKDSVRNTVIMDKNNIPAASKDLAANPNTLRVKEQRAESDPMGYSGTIANVRMSNGLVAEVQVNTAHMIYAKESPESAKAILGSTKYNQVAKETGKPGGMGHKLYEEYRVLHPVKDAAKREKIAAQSREYYKNFR
jgi:hypothetical protein